MRVTPKILSVTVILDSSTALHFIRDAITAVCNSSSAMVRTLEFNIAKCDFLIMNEIFMSLPWMMRKYAHVLYASCDESSKLCSSTVAPLSLLKP